MNKSENNQQISNDEIDLKALFLTLWQGKWVISFITLIGAAIALVYVLMAQSWWTSTAIIDLPTDSQLFNYKKVANNYNNFMEYEVWSNDTVLKNFITEFNSANSQKHFLQSQEKLKSYDNWSSAQALLSDPKNSGSGFKLSVQSTTQQNSLDLLTKYIDYINQKVNQNMAQDLQSAVDLKINNLQVKEAILKPQIIENFKVELFKIDESYKIAKMAGINKPINDNSEQSDMFAINLGALALKAKSDILHSIEKNIDDNLNLISPEWKTLQSQLSNLTAKKVVTFSDIETYQYLASPEMLSSRDKPKRALIVIIGFLLGGIMGCGLVLVRSGFKEEK